MKFSKGKCKVLLLGQNSPKQQYRLQSNLQENSSARKDLGILEDSKLYKSPVQASSAGSPQCRLVCIRQSVVSRSKEVNISLYLSLIKITCAVLSPM